MELNKNKKYIEKFYNEDCDEDVRFDKKSTSVEFLTTMRYVQKFAKKGCKILEVGAGTGRYSIALAKMGFDVTAVELVEKNLEVLKKNAKGLKNIKAYQGDALKLDFADNSFDLVLNLGPLYHLFNKKDKMRAIKESVRVCKPNGICMFAYLTHSSVVWEYGVRKGEANKLINYFDKDFRIKDIPSEVFSCYYIDEFKKQFDKLNTSYLTNLTTDSLFGTMRDYIDDKILNKGFDTLLNWHFATCERLDHQGLSSHMLYICRKDKN